MINKIAYYVLFISLISCNLSAQNKYSKKQKKLTSKRILKNNKWAFVNSNNDTIQYKYIQKIDTDFFLAETNNKKSGYIDKNGTIIIPIEYDFLGVFSEGLAPAKKNGKSGFIDRNGKTIVDFIYDGTGYFYSCGLSRVWKGEKVGFIDKKGKVIIPIIYDKADYNKVDNFVVLGKRKSKKSIPIGSDKERFKWAFFSNKGVQLTDFKYNKIYESQLKDRDYTMLENGLILVERKGKFAYLNSDFQIVIPFGKYKTAKPINNKGVAIVGNKKKYGLINKKGKILIPINFEYIENAHFNNDIYIVSKNNKFGLFDKNGKKLLRVENSEIIRDNSSNNNSFLLFKNKNNKFGTTNKYGKPIIPFVYDTIVEFDGNDISIAEKFKKFGIINFNNEIIVPFDYDNISSTGFNNDFYTVTKENKHGLINNKGKLVIPLKYENIEPCYYAENKQFIIKKGNKFGIIDIDENIIIPISYNYISNWIEYGPDSHYVKKNGKEGLISRKGKILFDTIYDWISAYPEYNLVMVSSNKKIGLFDFSHNVILPIRFDKIYLPFDDYEMKDFYVKRGNKYHLYNRKGKLIKENVSYKKIKKIIKQFEN